MGQRQIRILQIVTQMGRGGLETMLMNYDRYIDHDIIQFDFLEHWNTVTDYDPEILELGGKIYRLPRLNPFNPYYLHTLNSFFKDHSEYRIVHAHLDCMSGIPLKYAKKNGVPVRIAHAHSISEIKNYKYPVKLIFKKGILTAATDYIACGKEAGQWMFSGRPFSVLNNAIDAEKYVFNDQVRAEVRAELGIDADTLIVGHVGSLWYPKNHMFLLETFSSLIKTREKSKLLLVGQGPMESEIRQKCEALNIEDKVIFTGLRSDVNRILQAMDVFVFPSHYEGVSLVSIEAQASGLPCIFSENIPSECVVTEGLVKQMSLQEHADIWAREILAAAEKRRRNTLIQIRKSGFDVKQNAAILQQFYIDRWEGLERHI